MAEPDKFSTAVASRSSLASRAIGLPSALAPQSVNGTSAGGAAAASRGAANGRLSAPDRPTAPVASEPAATAADGESQSSEGVSVPHAVAVPPTLILQCGIILVSVTVLAFALNWWFEGKTGASTLWVQVLLGAATVSGICWGAWQRYRLLTLPMRRLSDVVARVRQGDLPLDALSAVEGVPGVLVPVLRDLLIDLKTRRAEIAQLEQEMSQRVANRTDALERMLGSLREKASRDPLTGLYNRRMLDESLPKLISQPDRVEPLTVLMIDVDYFKLLNDTLGHAAGDELLRSIGQLIRSAVRESDLGFRCGGDEFVIVLDGKTREAGQALADRLTSLVDAMGKTLRVPKAPRLSIGIAELQASQTNAGALLESADRALYAVKKARKEADRARGVAVFERK